MRQRRTVWLVLLLAGWWSALPASAAPPALPAAALGNQTLGVLWIDALQMDTAKLRSAVRATFVERAALIARFFGEYETFHAPFVRAGGTSMAIVYTHQPLQRSVANPIYLFSVAQRGDEAAVKAVITSAVGKEVAFETLEGWVVAYDRRLAFPYLEKGSVERLERFRSALGPIRNKAAVLAFVPNERMAALYEDASIDDKATPAPMKDLIKQLLAVKYLSATVDLGDEPAVSIRVEAPLEVAASRLLSLRPQVLAAIEPIVKRPDMRGVPIELINPLFAYHAVLAHATVERDGDAVTLQLSGVPLTRVAHAVLDGAVAAFKESCTVQSINKMKALVLALVQYARDHQGEFPAQLTDLRVNEFVDKFDALMLNPNTGDKVGYIYVKPRATFQQLYKDRRLGLTPILYESRNGRIDTKGLIAYASTNVDRPDPSDGAHERPER